MPGDSREGAGAALVLTSFIVLFLAFTLYDNDHSVLGGVVLFGGLFVLLPILYERWGRP